MRNIARIYFALAIIAAVGFGAPAIAAGKPVRARPSDGATQHYLAGEKAYKAGDYTTAIVEWAKVRQLRPSEHTECMISLATDALKKEEESRRGQGTSQSRVTTYESIEVSKALLAERTRIRRRAALRAAHDTAARIRPVSRITTRPTRRRGKALRAVGTNPWLRGRLTQQAVSNLLWQAGERMVAQQNQANRTDDWIRYTSNRPAFYRKYGL